MHSTKPRVFAGAIALVMLGIAGQAQANPGFDPVFVNTTPAGANTAFNYTLNFGGTGGAERLQAGDFVTIYDIPGFVSATAGVSFSVSTQNSGINAPGTAPGDDPSLPNVTFSYTGPTITTDQVFSGFNVVSSFSLQGLDFFTSQTTNNTNSTPIGHIGMVTVPGVPEPASLALVATAAGVLLARRRR